MSEIDVRLRPRPRGWARLPVLDPAQAAVVEAARHRDVIARGAPSSGRTTVALAVLAEAVSGGRSAVLLVPDRGRADHLAPRAQVLAPNAVRPVRTPASFAYQVVSTWRTQRRSPLGPVELVTGSAQDQAIARLIESVPAPWPDQIPAQMRAMPAFRAELRNLFARAGEAGMDGDALIAAGERFGQGQWVAAGHLLRELLDASVTGPECPGALRVDLSRIQALAADLVGSWEHDGAAAGVSAPPPVPDVVVVDDLQDCTPSTITLLGACSAAGARVVALSDSDVAVAGYRGGEPHLDLRLASLLGAGIDELDRVHGPSPRIRALVAEAASRVTQSGPSARRRAGADGDDAERPLRTHLAATPAQMGALIARELRAHRLHDAVAWSGQVVIVRSASMVDEMRRHLSRGGVPVAGGGRAFDFASQPERFPLYNTPDESYHGLVYARDLGVGGALGANLAFLLRIQTLINRDLGAVTSPFNAFLISQGIETLSLRIERHVSNALAVARFLEAHPDVESVNYAGLESSPYYELGKKYAPLGTGGLLSFVIKGGYEAGRAFADGVQLLPVVANIGDAKSLVIHPASTTHSQLTEEELVKAGVAPGTVRLSIGLENIKDILADLELGFDAARAATA